MRASTTARPTTTVARPTSRITASQATSVLRTYFLTAGARNYDGAWNMCTPKYQEKYASYENFDKFWNSVALVGIDATEDGGVTASGSRILFADVWFDGVSGRRSSERIRIEVIRQGDLLMIDDYRFLNSR